ncbi:uncharacterized protein LOC124149722 [Haliotis rufescens]|uniref:uncharacterized protein LOC124149722 n=1 Tax=Haliotis rufescens TaxID=6454 RepID=UPI00201F9FA6|nr:uncharacterized protein LOC124149722 [Haliotis rufescens]
MAEGGIGSTGLAALIDAIDEPNQFLFDYLLRPQSRRRSSLLSSGCLLEMQPDDHPHHEEYAEVIVPRYSTDDFQSHFRLHRTSFEQLCQELHQTDPSIVTTFSGGNTPVSLEKSTMITLWYLANQDSMRTISVKFGVAKSSVHSVVHTVNTGVIGAIDGCHIPIKAPSSHQEDYNNRKMTHTVILQAVCDSHGVFTDCFAGVPGSAHDARVFSHSNLSQSFQSDVAQHFPDEKYHLVGDSAYMYALKKWLMVPYKDYDSVESDDSYGVATPQPTGNTSSTAGSLKCDAIANSL